MVPRRTTEINIPFPSPRPARRFPPVDTTIVSFEGFGAVVEDLGLADPARVIAFRGDAVVANNRKARVVRFRHAALPGEDLFLKWYIATTLRAKFTSTYRPSRAERECRALKAMRALGADAAEPVAFGAFRRWRVVVLSFLVTRAIPGAVPLEALLADRSALPGVCRSSAADRAAARVLGGTVGRLHRGGFRHGDLYTRNVLVTVGEAAPRFHLIDAPSGEVVPAGRKAERLRIHDLAAIEKGARRFVPPRIRLAFFRAYLAAAGLPRRAEAIRGAILARVEAKTAESRRTEARRRSDPAAASRAADRARRELRRLGAEGSGSARQD